MRSIFKGAVFFLCMGNLLVAGQKPLEKVSLQLQWLHQFQFAGYYMAREKGFYKEAGLDVDILLPTPETDVTDEVVSGRSEYGVGRSSLIIDRIRNKPVVMLGAVFQTSPIALLTKKSSGIHTLSDLRGKRVMLTRDVATSASIISMLASQGITMSDIVAQDQSFDLEDLIQGRTDAFSAYVTNQPFVLQKKGIEYTLFSPESYGFDFYSDIFFTGETELKEHPERVRAFYEATLKGWRYAFDHIPEAARLIHTKYNPQGKTLEALIFEGRELKKLAYKEGIPLGSISMEKVQGIANIYMVLGFYTKDYSLDGLVYDIHTDRERSLYLSEAEQSWLKEHPVLRVGIDRNWAPFEFVDKKGVYRGISADYLALVEKRLGVTFRIEESHPWSEVVAMMKEKKLDIYSSVVQTPARQAYMDFTLPYLSSFPTVIVTRDDVAFIRNMGELDGKKVSVGNEYMTHDFLRQYHPRIELLPVETVEEGLQKVAYNEAYAFVGNIATVTHCIKERGLTNLKVAGEAPYPFELAMAGRKDWPMLTPLLQKALDSISQEERDAIYKKWIVVRYDHGVDYTLLWKVVGGFVLFLGVLFYWQRQTERNKRRLQDEVNEKIEELRIRDSMIQRKSQMAAMGEMIVVIAHQFKQPLCALLGNIDSIAHLYEDGELDGKAMKAFQERGHRQIRFMNETVDDFKNFYRPGKGKKAFDVNQAVGKMITILSAHYHASQIALTAELWDEPVCFFGVEGEMQQVVLNLTNNAKDALLERGTKYPEIRIETARDGNMGMIRVSDNAGGIEEEIMERIFDPYFSTKGDGGTGIGLYLGRRIITESFGGTIEAHNASDGAVFTIRIPLAKA